MLKFKKSLVWLLVLCLALVCVPFAAMASEGSEAPDPLSYAEFNTIIKDSVDGVYDGNGITVVLGKNYY